MGTAALVLGILALLSCWTIIGGIVLGLLAVVFGVVGRSRVRRGVATNGGAALFGTIVGAIGLIVGIVIVAAGVGFFFTHSSTINNLTSCLQHAGSAHARTACYNQYRQKLTP